MDSEGLAMNRHQLEVICESLLRATDDDFREALIRLEDRRPGARETLRRFLERVPEPAHMKVYREFWAPLIETSGKLDLDKVARELSDYRMVMEEVGKAYCELTGGALSKPNTAAAHVIDFTERNFARQYADEVCDEAQGRYDEGDTAIGDALRELAEGWHPGAWQDHAKARERRIAAMAGHGGKGE